MGVCLCEQQRGVFVFWISRRFLLCPLGWEAVVKMCITADSVSMSVLLVVFVTDGAADSGELDLSGIDDSEIELVRTCCLMSSSQFLQTASPEDSQVLQS